MQRTDRLSDMIYRANEIRKRYDEFEERTYGRKWTKEEIAMGFVGDVGDLIKVVMAKRGIRGPSHDVDTKLKHELADCLWSILVLSEQYGIDIESEFYDTMKQIERRLTDA